MISLPKIPLSPEAGRAIVDALLDVFSPITETFAWGGDVVRVYRTRTALKCFRRTKQIAAAAGVKLKAPPVKFLSQFIENCSLEDENDDALIDWWARLLVDAGSKYESKHVFYANVLKQVSAIELELLETLVRNGRGAYTLVQASEAEFVSDFAAAAADLKFPDKLTVKNIRAAVKLLRKEIQFPGVLLLDIFIDDKDSHQYQELHPDYTDEELANWQVLQALQLVRLSFQTFVAGTTYYRVRSATLTELGAAFYFSCHEQTYKRRISTGVRFKRKLMRKRSPRMATNRRRETT